MLVSTGQMVLRNHSFVSNEVNFHKIREDSWQLTTKEVKNEKNKEVWNFFHGEDGGQRAKKNRKKKNPLLNKK